MITIRAVDTTDGDSLEVLEFLQRTILPGDVPADTSKGYWWTANDDAEGMCVGFAGLYRSQRFTDVGYLCRAGVMPEYAGQGIQRRLIKVRVKKARALGFTELNTDTIPDNPRSSNNLIKCGFTLFLPEIDWAPGSLYWRKKL